MQKINGAKVIILGNDYIEVENKFKLVTCSGFITIYVPFPCKNYEALLFKTQSLQVLTSWVAVDLVLKMEHSCACGSCQIT
jgi:hypothetical protein